MRLDRCIARATGLSRAQARRVIRRGEVAVNGEPWRDPARPVTPEHGIAWRGERLAWPGRRYFMLNKPAGVVCATTDPVHPTVLGLLRSCNPSGLHVAGRLDIDATGLVLITDDGDWSHRITAPGRRCPKTYRVRLAEPLDAGLVQRFARGMRLRNETRLTRPAELEILGEREARVTLGEGRYHQVKRMFAACGNRVTALHRERIGPLVLDRALAPGASRPLRPDEVAAVR